MPDEIKVPHSAIAPTLGYIYVAPTDTPAPKFPFKPTSVTAAVDGDGESGEAEALKGIWKSVGNTSLENGIEMAVEGDDPEVLGSWQIPNLETTDPSKQYSLTMNLNDITVETLKLYYGAGDDNVVDKDFLIPASPTATDKALFILGHNGKQAIAWYYPSTKLIGADAITIDPAALTEVPIKAQILTGKLKNKKGDLVDSMGRVYPKTPFAGADAYTAPFIEG